MQVTGMGPVKFLEDALYGFLAHSNTIVFHFYLKILIGALGRNFNKKIII